METYEFVLGNTITIEFEFPDMELDGSEVIGMRFYEGYSIEDGLTELYTVDSSFNLVDDILIFTIQTEAFITFKGDTVIGHLHVDKAGYKVNKYFKLKAIME